MSEHIMDVPSSWTVAHLDELGRWSGGGTPSKANPDFWSDGTIPWVSPKDMKSDVIRTAEDFITPEAVEGSAAKLIAARSILMVTRSGILAHTFPVAVNDVTVTINQDLKALTPHPGLSDSYLRFFLVSRNRDILHSCSKHGTTVASIDTDRLKRVDVPIAPAGEQERIVEKIETLFAELDKGEEALRSVQKLLARYRQSVLKAAVTGTLTADWRAANPSPTETGQDLLTRILNHRRKTWQGRGRYKEPSEPDTADLPMLPEGWVWSTLEQVGFIKSGQTPRGVEEHIDEEGSIPWFKVSSMNEPGNEFMLMSSRWKFTVEGAKEAGLGILPVGAIAFPKRGGAILTNKKRRLGVSGALDLNTMGFVPVSLSEYVWTYFQGLDLRKIYDGSNVPQINYKDIALLPIGIPSCTEEAEVISALSAEAIDRINHLSENCEVELKRSAALRQSILKDAFAGKLVPQDPADEPAADLLARIRASQSTATKRSRKKASA